MSKDSLSNFYSGKRVFITGHTGFKGSWLAWWLTDLGADVIGYSLPPEDVRGNHFNLTGLASVLKGSFFGNIQNYEELTSSLQEYSPEIVFHLAAQPLVRRSYRNPIENYASNVMGTVNLLEAVRHTNSVKAVVNVTTDKCYENMEWPWPYRETDQLGGHDPYSSSKACAELISSAYRRSFLYEAGIALATARAGNVIGGGDFSEDRIIPDIVEAISKNEPVKLRYPNSIRPWQHVLDALHGYLLLGMKLSQERNTAPQNAFNFSPIIQENTTVQEITKLFISAIGRGRFQFTNDEMVPHEAALLKLDPSKAVTELNWRPILNIKQAVELTAAWFSSYLSNTKSIRETTIQQTRDFMNMIE